VNMNILVFLAKLLLVLRVVSSEQDNLSGSDDVMQDENLVHILLDFDDAEDRPGNLRRHLGKKGKTENERKENKRKKKEKKKALVAKLTKQAQKKCSGNKQACMNACVKYNIVNEGTCCDNSKHKSCKKIYKNFGTHGCSEYGTPWCGGGATIPTTPAPTASTPAPTASTPAPTSLPPQFEYVGTGECLDEFGQSYDNGGVQDSVVYDFQEVLIPEDCGSLCEAYGNPTSRRGFLATARVGSVYRCNCLYDDGQLPASLSFCSTEGNVGQGEITSSDDSNPAQFCFKKIG
jgi:hypothetical protein